MERWIEYLLAIMVVSLIHALQPMIQWAVETFEEVIA